MVKTMVPCKFSPKNQSIDFFLWKMVKYVDNTYLTIDGQDPTTTKVTQMANHWGTSPQEILPWSLYDAVTAYHNAFTYIRSYLSTV